MRTTLLVTLLLSSALAVPIDALQDRGAEVAQRYQQAAAEEDHAGLVELWKANPGLILVTIDADLEGSLKLRESSPEPDEDAIAALHARALAGARAAAEATGHPILLDYASAFVGWDREQQRRFRAGQAAFGRARGAAKAGDQEAAAAAGLECAELAEPLGDWWGTAMGHSAHGQALLALGRFDEALVALSRARMIYHDLGLVGSEYGNARGVVTALRELGRTERCRAAALASIELARAVGDEQGLAELEGLVQELPGS